MTPSDFVYPSTGTLVPTIHRQFAFVPAPLPPMLDLAAIAMAMADAMQAIGELKGACRRLQNANILVRPLQRREALTSSAMEGTFTTNDDLLLAEAGVEPKADEATQEVVNYLTALDESLRLLESLPISHRILKRAHEILLSKLSSIRGAQKHPGDYKREQNWIGGRTIDQARYVPPPPAETQTCMDALERYLNREGQQLPTALIDLALAHYQIEAIHPFADGNGRVGRMLVSLMSVYTGLLDKPVLYLSPAIERQKDRYIDLMFNVSTKGEWSEWLIFFFERILESCRETVQTVDRLINLQATYRELVTKTGRTSNALSLVDLLFEQPVITVTQAKGKLAVSYPAARSTIDKLVEQKILVAYEGRYPIVFFAPGIILASQPPSNAGQTLQVEPAGPPL